MSAMNGKKCRVLGSLNEHEQRYPVFVLDTKDVVLIKPSNLVPVNMEHLEEEKAQMDDGQHILDISLLRGREYRLKDNATILYYEKFLDESRVQSLWQELMTLNFEQSEWKGAGGRTYKTPRLQSWMRDDGITNKMASLYQKQPGFRWSASMMMIKRTIEKMLDCTFHYVLINWYRDGKDSIAWHSDGEAQSRCKNVVGSVSLGGPRKFLLRHNDFKKMGVVGKKEFLLQSGCLLVMKDDTQIMWKHSVPKSGKHRNPRINLTFRQVCDCESCAK